MGDSEYSITSPFWLVTYFRWQGKGKSNLEILCNVQVYADPIRKGRLFNFNVDIKFSLFSKIAIQVGFAEE